MVVFGVLWMKCGEVMYKGAKVQDVLMMLDVMVEDDDKTGSCDGGVVSLTGYEGHRGDDGYGGHWQQLHQLDHPCTQPEMH